MSKRDLLYEAGVVQGGLELLRNALIKNDPQRELLIRVADIRKDMDKLVSKIK